MPVRKSTPSHDLTRCTYLLWGEPKTGKTTFASRFPGATFIATEDGMKGVEASRWETEDGRYVTQSWTEILAATNEVIAQSPRPSMIVLDTADNAYFLVERYVCEKYGVEYKTDDALAYGKGTAIINGEFRRYLLKLSSLGIGVVLTSHTAPQEKDTKKGHVTIARPSLPDKVLPMVVGMVDFIFYATTETWKKDASSEPVTRHVMYTRPAPTHMAGHRIGNLPEVLPLSYPAFVKAFETGRPVTNAATTTPAVPPTTPAASTPASTASTSKRNGNGNGNGNNGNGNGKKQMAIEMPDGSVITPDAAAAASTSAPAAPAPTTTTNEER